MPVIPVLDRWSLADCPVLGQTELHSMTLSQNKIKQKTKKTTKNQKTRNKTTKQKGQCKRDLDLIVK
jgi:hypothetical protein